MTVNFEIWYHPDLLEDPTARLPDLRSTMRTLDLALKEFCEGSATVSNFLDLVVHDVETGQWHEIAMKRVSWTIDFQQTEKYNFTRERCK